MNLHKYLLVAIMLLGGLILATGCSSEKTAAPANNDSPDIIVKNFFGSLQRGEFQQAASFLKKDDQDLRELSADPEGEKVAKLFLQKLTYETGSYDIKGDEATISVKITVPNMLKISGAAAKGIVSEAMSGQMNDDTQAEHKVLEKIEASIKDPSAPTITTTQTIKLTKTESGWKISTMDTDFLKTFFGS
ncbi:hypothetical protein [Aneurinibacillus uraniidurans]|uniref:hypothetical protein n=1 Tax=Aneurinibacillus uraniidurans TaxID=2966586 RepID=UPI00234A2235|nr:hypothetical protein [Aneurinibacillus sp. B1]WCN39440.1 hypothetical protein PO771_08630 [Aneurinibacillus sp. B1]